MGTREAPAMQRRPGGGVLTLVGPEQPATPPSAGVESSDQPPVALGWAGALGPTRERAAMQPCRVEHWDAGALRRWGAQALRRWGAGALGRSKRAARVG
jgi:hypothetical protein